MYSEAKIMHFQLCTPICMKCMKSPSPRSSWWPFPPSQGNFTTDDTQSRMLYLCIYISCLYICDIYKYAPYPALSWTRGTLYGSRHSLDIRAAGNWYDADFYASSCGRRLRNERNHRSWVEHFTRAACNYLKSLTCSIIYGSDITF